MGTYKFLAFLAMSALFAIYHFWLRNEMAKGRGRGFLHRDIKVPLLILGVGAWAAYEAYTTFGT